jgi:AraC-like DNA-binding protein
VEQGILCGGNTSSNNPSVQIVTIAIATAIFGQRTENRTLTTWEGLAAKANYSASGLARLCGVSLRTVQRHFRKNYELSLREWLNGVRLELARRRLQGGGRVKQVAFEAGFKQVSSFSRAFKERYGVPPSFCYVTGLKCHGVFWKNGVTFDNEPTAGTLRRTARV